MIRMMGYTKWIAVLLCFLGMTACRQDAPRFRIGVAQCSDDSWRHKMNDEILREAMFYDGVSVEIRSAADDNRKQAEDLLRSLATLCGKQRQASYKEVNRFVHDSLR